MTTLAERIAYSDSDFEFIRAFMADVTGINLHPAKRELVYSRLVKRVRALGLTNFSEYCSQLRSDAAELHHCVNAMTTNVTSFFRESHHFDYLRQVVIPERLAATEYERASGLKVWSAGCSSGEEPYSIAMTAQACLAKHPGHKLSVDATDLDSNILARASKGVYRMKDVAGLDNDVLRRWFKKGRGQNDGKVRIVDEIRSLVTFYQLNLKESWDDECYDVIFCRNVMIYFDVELKRQIINRFAEKLKPGGYLFVGHSESLFGLSEHFEVVGKTIHRARH